jgi:N-acetylmuramoyl-L-alanine amidase
LISFRFVENICGKIIHRDSAARMSANPHNTSLGLADGDKAADSRLPAPPSSAIPAVTYPPGHEALQALLAFSSLHEQLRQRRNREQRGKADPAEVWELEPFVLDEVLHLVAERALTITGADGVAIAMAEGNAIVCRASAGIIAPDPGVRLDPHSGFSGACLRSGGIVRCDDSEKDRRVDVEVCRRLGTRSMVAVPIAGLHGTIGLLEAFSAGPYGFNDSDVRSLNLLAELILAALKPEEEGRLAELSHRLVAGEPAEASPQTIPDLEESVTLPASSENSAAVHETEINPPGVESEPTGEFRVALLVLLVLVVLAAVSGLVAWWRIARRAPSATGSSSAPAPNSAPVVAPSTALDQPATISPAAGARTDSTHVLDPKLALRQLVTGIWHVSSADSSTVVIDVQGEVQYEAHRISKPDRIYIDLHDTVLAPGLFGKTIEVGDTLLARVRVAQPRRGVSRVVLETTGASDFSVSMQSNPYRLVVEIQKAASPPAGPVSDVSKSGALVAIAPQSPSLTIPGPAGNKLTVPSRIHVPKFRLVLDAGHGGWDLGTVGRKGLMEKDLVLDIVERLGKLVQSRLDAEIVYTRLGDDYLPLEKRTEIANLAQADMFVSVHANYSNDSSARGAETYYTNTYSSLRARTPEADAREAGENSGVTENINWTDVDIREKVRQSRRFAVAVQQSLYRALAAQIPGMRNRGVKKASYVVLTGTSMPAILAEVSFVSNTQDEDKLQNSSYRQAIAEALYKGVAQFAATSHRVNMASAPAKHTGL